MGKPGATAGTATGAPTYLLHPLPEDHTAHVAEEGFPVEPRFLSRVQSGKIPASLTCNTHGNQTSSGHVKGAGRGVRQFASQYDTNVCYIHMKLMRIPYDIHNIDAAIDNLFSLGPVSYTHLTLPTIYSV